MNNYLRVKIKVLSIFLVVLVVIVHSYNTGFNADPEGLHSISGINGFIQELICQGFNRIASPLFFIISGYLFFVNISGNAGDFINKARKRFFTLIIPYIFWSVWGIVLYLFLQAALPASVSFSKGLIAHYNPVEILYTIFFDPVPYQLWYVRDLTVFVILSPVLYYLLKYMKFFLVLILIMTWLLDVDFVVFKNQSLLFFSLGAYISWYAGDLAGRKSKPVVIVASVLWIVINLLKTILIYKDYQNLNVLLVLHKSGIAAGITAINYSYNLFIKDEEKILKLKYFGIVSFSFFLFASHEPVCTILKKGLLMISGSGDMSLFLVFLLTPVLSIVLCLSAGYTLKRYLPKFYGTITGWR
jgi:surface polysaccharide O-acyltransferase-like enzyme